MNEEQKILSEIEETVEKLKELHDLAYTQYSRAVDAVISKQIVDDRQVEHLLDGIIDLGDDVRFIELMKKLCRHIYFQYPQLVGDYIHMFRSLYEGCEEEDGIRDDYI